MAAFGLAMRLNMVPEMLCMGLCMGGIPLYAYAYGARNGVRVKEALRTSLETTNPAEAFYSKRARKRAAKDTGRK